MDKENDVFITQRITNRDIYTKLEDIEEHVKRTNGHVRANKWNIRFIWFSLTVLGTVLFFLAKLHLS